MKPSVLVLIADNEDAIRFLLQTSFEEGGFQVVLAATGEAAMKVMDSKRDAVSALVTDVNFGRNATGWEVAKHARDLNPNLPVVYITGGDGHEWSSMGVPNSILITKPFAPAQAVTAVSQLLNAGNTPGS